MERRIAVDNLSAFFLIVSFIWESRCCLLSLFASQKLWVFKLILRNTQIELKHLGRKNSRCFPFPLKNSVLLIFETIL
jgi:hypothetical protein